MLTVILQGKAVSGQVFGDEARETNSVPMRVDAPIRSKKNSKQRDMA
jgi:hypothetical protein